MGPDLNVNGDAAEADVDGSPGTDPVSSAASEAQTSPAEGNSMLGKTHFRFKHVSAWLSARFIPKYRAKGLNGLQSRKITVWNFGMNLFAVIFDLKG